MTSLAARPTSILFAAPVLAGGVASSLRVLVSELEKAGNQCGVFAYESDAAALGASCSLGVNLGHKKRLTLLLSSGAVDVLHLTASIAADPAILRVIRLSGFRGPIVSTTHGSQPVDLSNLPLVAVTAVSASAAAATIPPSGIDVRVIPNAPDTATFRPGNAEADREPMLLWVGRSGGSDRVSKDAIGFLLFTASVEGRSSRSVLVDAEDNRLFLGIDEWFGGRVDYRCLLAPQEVAELYREAASSGGAWISTSRDEGMPMCLLEAWACGCPVVVPDVPGFDMVAHGVNGLKYKRADGISGIGRCVASLHDPHLRQCLVREGLKLIATRYSPPVIAGAYLSLYDEVLSQCQPPRRQLPSLRHAALKCGAWAAATLVAGYRRLRGLPRHEGVP